MELRSGYEPGCIGRIAELHGLYYSKAAGFGAPFEAKVASELSAFCLRYAEGRDGLWHAHEGGALHGAIAVEGPHDGDPGVHLRWFIVSDALRGRGVGNRLLGEALGFCERAGHREVDLWTFEGLDAARHLYEKHGFALAASQRGARWGREVNEQRFVRRSPGNAPREKVTP